MMRRVLLACLPRSSCFPSRAARRPKRVDHRNRPLKFTWIADPQISPMAPPWCSSVIVNEKENRYETSLYTVPASGRETAAAADLGHPRHVAALGARRQGASRSRAID